jgi:cytochrome P450
MSFFDVLATTLKDVVDRFGTDLNELPHEADALVEGAIRDAGDKAAGFVNDLKKWALAHPRQTFAILRKLKPILVVENTVIVTRADDVSEILERDDIFQVTYGPKMEAITLGNNFFLGMQDIPQYTRDVSNMRLCVRRDDLPGRIAPFIDTRSRAIVGAAPGRLDIVRDLTRVVPTELVGDYFGTPGPDVQTFADWATTLFQYIFVDPDNDPALAPKAMDSAARMRATLDDAVAARKLNRGKLDDVLGRCLVLQDAGLPGMTDLDIRNNLLGILVGLIPTTSQAVAQVIDQLLDRPDALTAARAAALAGDDELLSKYVFEALRFNPVNPGLLRVAGQDYVIGRGTLRATTIPKGATVLAATLSAMFDTTMLADPDTFRVDRPESIYLLFGTGLHQCFGRYINRIQIPTIAKALIERPNLRRAPGEAGTLVMDGPFPRSLTVEFD